MYQHRGTSEPKAQRRLRLLLILPFAPENPAAPARWDKAERDKADECGHSVRTPAVARRPGTELPATTSSFECCLPRRVVSSGAAGLHELFLLAGAPRESPAATATFPSAK